MPPTAQLTADIGGTRARFLYSPRARGAVPLRFELASRDFDDLESLLAHALLLLKVSAPAVLDAALAVAGPVRDGYVKFTRLPWSAAATELKRRFGLRRVLLLNDLEAAAWALAEKPPVGALRLRTGSGDGRCVLISVGTGLGTAYWSRPRGRLHIDAAEAGHAGFAPSRDWEVEYLRALQRRYGERISWERLLCGEGLASLHAFLRHSDEILPPATVVERANSGEAAAHETLRRFCSLLGNFAGDLVLTAPAAGGVWLAGAVLANMGALFDAPLFLRDFDRKGRLAPLLAQVPVDLTRDNDLGVRGAGLAIHAGRYA